MCSQAGHRGSPVGAWVALGSSSFCLLRHPEDSMFRRLDHWSLLCGVQVSPEFGHHLFFLGLGGHLRWTENLYAWNLARGFLLH